MSMEGHVSAPDNEAIAKLAYQIWEERGRPPGSAEGDWYEAERQLQIQTGAMPRSPTGQTLGPRRTRTGARTKRRPSA
jgi:hypothetical protein